MARGTPRIWSPLLLSTLLLGTVLSSGCLNLGGHCEALHPRVRWEQEGIWDAFPDPGSHGPYNIQNETEGRLPLDDPDRGFKLLRSVSVDHEWLSSDYGFTTNDPFRLNIEGKASVEVPPGTPSEIVHERFLAFTKNLTTADLETRQDWADEFLANQSAGRVHHPPVPIGEEAPEGPTYLRFTLQLDGPFRFQQHYDELRAAHGPGETHHFSSGVRFDAWTYNAGPAVHMAYHEDRTHRIAVDSYDRARITLDPDRFEDSDALRTFIHNATALLGLEAPPDDLTLTHLRPC